MKIGNSSALGPRPWALAPRPFAFTLIELLVVITIIVILLALLAPALDKAIYHAELTTCSARLRAIAIGITTYASANGRRYPYRPTFDLAKTYPSTIKVPVGYTSSADRTADADDRPYLRGYLSIKQNLLDPFVVQTVNLDEPLGTPVDTTLIFASYSLWYGAQFPKERAMRRLGDRFTYDGHSFNVLASDPFGVRTDQPSISASHPDFDGVLQKWSAQDVRQANVTFTRSWWGAGAPRCGPIDMNFALEDGSVVRHYAVKYDAGSSANPDKGPITGVPDDMRGTTNGNAWWNNLVKER